MAKITKRGRNPGAVDSWLDTLGLYRKNVAYDETCLFRAVSEQLFDCQVFHERVRRECIAYARNNFYQFSYLVESYEQWQEHLSSLEKHMVVCGNIEIQIISQKYSRDVVIFDASKQDMVQATNNNFKESLLLCLMDEDHYDVIYKRDHIVTAGFCQSIIYKLLYENVFHISNVDEIVKNMLYEKNTIITQGELLAAQKKIPPELNNNQEDISTLSEKGEVAKFVTEITNIAPFPFKVAKALDPTIYRNIEYDSWGEVRREMRLGEWYYGDNKLILGTRCILNDKYTKEMHDCYIQEIIKDQNKCVVYLTKLAEKRTVNYADLSPESDAKPWPLPYRFSKNLVIAGSPTVPPVEKVSRTVKKRNKEKKRTKCCGEPAANLNNSANSTEPENVSAYVGVPLQMHDPNGTPGYHDSETSAETQTEPSIPEPIITPDIQSPYPRYSWDQAQWQQFFPSTPDPMVWPQTPTTPQVFNYVKPMVASAPATPDVVPYHDNSFPFYYNYHVDSFPSSNQWQTSCIELQSSQFKQEATDKCNEDPNKSQSSQTETNFCAFPDNDSVFEQQSTTLPERPMVCTTLTPQSTPVEMYPSMIPVPSGTPVVYTPVPPEMVVSSPPIMYAPPQMDMQYLSPAPYVYPPTPPAAWYPTGVNAHGFIFPSRPQ